MVIHHAAHNGPEYFRLFRVGLKVATIRCDTESEGHVDKFPRSRRRCVLTFPLDSREPPSGSAPALNQDWVKVTADQIAHTFRAHDLSHLRRRPGISPATLSD
jgi:hypothetical protein